MGGRAILRPGRIYFPHPDGNIDWVCATIFGATKAAFYYTSLAWRSEIKKDI